MVFSMSKEGTRGPRFAIAEDIVAELVDPGALKRVP
jgi:hypothetical protein